MDCAAPLLRVVDAVYGAAMEPERWSSTFDTITDLLNSHHAMMAVYGVGNAVEFATGARVDPSNAARMQRVGDAARGAWLHALPANGVTWSGAVYPDNEFRRSAYYNEIVRPMNGFYAIYGHARWSNESAACVAICRPPGTDAPTNAEFATLRALLPHLANALQIQFRLKTVIQQGGSAFRLLETALWVFGRSAPWPGYDKVRQALPSSRRQ